MNFTKETHDLMSYFIKHKCILNNGKLNKNVEGLLTNLYYQIKISLAFIDTFNINDPILTKISKPSKIPKPTTFPSGSIPEEVDNYINGNIVSSLSYSIELSDRNVTILFLLEENLTNKVVSKYNIYVKYILAWLNIAGKYASKKCSSNLTIFLYHTSLTKELPISGSEILNEIHVNTAFTKTCQSTSEIVIFRKEEWFKVLIHETFHNFALDFSNMNTNTCHSKILEIFPVNSSVNLYESYTEFWARLINVIFSTYTHMKNKSDQGEFLSLFKQLMNVEQTFSLFQMVKVLNHMGLTYKHLYSKTTTASQLRNRFYKEETNVLSYYIITSILINNYQLLLEWCNENNDFLLCFKKSAVNMIRYCEFIEDHYTSQRLIKGVKCVEELMRKLIQSKLTKINNYVFKTTRMTVCELE